MGRALPGFGYRKPTLAARGSRGVFRLGAQIKNSYASETPCKDGERLYAYFGNVGMFAFTLDGTPVWQRRWERRKTRANWGSTASPWASDGKIFCLSEDGDTFVIQAGREMKVLAKNSLGEMCMASPALLPDALLICRIEALYRIGPSPTTK